MKAYLVTFRNKKTGAVKKEVKVYYDETVVKKTPNVLALAALEELTERGETLPKKRGIKATWREF